MVRENDEVEPCGEGPVGPGLQLLGSGHAFESACELALGLDRASLEGRVQRAIACAFQSRFSSGGARSHSLDFEGSVDSVYLGCWRRITGRS